MATGRNDVHGVLVVDKPRGLTSHDVVARVRRVVGQKSVGHAGTLDPMATGVLVVLLGEATKLTPWLTANAKSYTCTLQLGVETASGDADGLEARREPIGPELQHALRLAESGAISDVLEQALQVERGRTQQVPPVISAIHVDGVRAYERVRRGEEVVLESRAVATERLTLEGVQAADARLTVSLHVSKGYYVRAFARDLAASLGTVAHLTALRRSQSGPFTLSHALTLDDLTRDVALAALISCESAAQLALPTIILDTEKTAFARQGKRFPWPDFREPVVHAWLDDGGKLVAVGEARDGLACVVRGFFAPSSQGG